MGTNPDVFTAAYDADAALTLQVFPTGLRRASTFDEAGELTALSYAKDGATWLS